MKGRLKQEEREGEREGSKNGWVDGRMEEGGVGK